MNRSDEFKKLIFHPWYKKSYLKLTLVEMEICEKFLSDNAEKSNDQFCHDVNRMFLDQPAKPKNFTTIMELLSVAASNCRGK